MKRLVASFISLFVILNICVINIYADEEQSYLDWLKQACTNIGDLIDGNITTDEFLSRSSELVVNPHNIPSMALNTYTQIQDSVRSLSSDMLPQDFYNFLGKIASPLFETHREYVKKPARDLKGYGSLLIWRTGSGAYTYYYGDYINISKQSGKYFVDQYGNVYYEVHSSSGDSSGYRDGISLQFTESNLGQFSFYGDVRILGGASSDLVEPEIDVPVYNFDSDSSADLSQLLNRFLEALKMQQPDLSSVEGLLQSIYYRLGSLDSDNDSATLSLLNASINQLISDNNANNQALIEKLESLKGGTGESGEFDIEGLRDLIKGLMPEVDDMTGTEQVKAALLSKFSFVEELKSLIQRFINSYRSSSDKRPVIHVDYSDGTVPTWLMGVLGYFDIDLSADGKLDKFLPAFHALSASIIYLSFAWNTYKKIPNYIGGGS